MTDINSTTTLAENDRYESKHIQNAFQLKSGDTSTEFVRLRQLRESRESCRFCELLCKAVERFSLPNTSDHIVCSLSWEVDGRKIQRGGFVNSTRRIRLNWSDDVQSKSKSSGDRVNCEVYLVFVAPRNPLRPNSDAMIQSSHETHFLGRDPGGLNENQALLKSWLDMCVKDHTEVCAKTHGGEKKFMELISESYFGVIDILDVQLKVLPVKNGK